MHWLKGPGDLCALGFARCLSLFTGSYGACQNGHQGVLSQCALRHLFLSGGWSLGVPRQVGHCLSLASLPALHGWKDGLGIYQWDSGQRDSAAGTALVARDAPLGGHWWLGMISLGNGAFGHWKCIFTGECTLSWDCLQSLDTTVSALQALVLLFYHFLCCFPRGI